MRLNMDSAANNINHIIVFSNASPCALIQRTLPNYTMQRWKFWSKPWTLCIEAWFRWFGRPEIGFPLRSQILHDQTTVICTIWLMKYWFRQVQAQYSVSSTPSISPNSKACKRRQSFWEFQYSVSLLCCSN